MTSEGLTKESIVYWTIRSSQV